MSTIVVTPPQAAAREPVSNVSLANVPPKGSSMCVCTSMPPGITYLPAASMMTASPSSAKNPGLPTAVMTSSVINTSWAMTPWVETTLPFLINVVVMVRLPLHQLVVGVGPAVPVEGPAITYQFDLVDVEVAHDELRLVRVAHVADELTFGVHEVALPVEVVVAERLDAHAVDGADVVHVGDGSGRLLDAPDVLAEAAMCGRRVEHDLGAVQAKGPPTLGEVAVVADVDANLADRRLEDRIATVAGTEVELLPEALGLRNVLLAELAEVLPVGVDHGRGVVVHPGLLVLVHRQHHHHAELLGDARELLGGRPVGDQLGVAVVLGVLHLAEVGAVEQLLEADDLGAFSLGIVRGLFVLFDHRLLRSCPVGLKKRSTDDVRHEA